MRYKNFNTEDSVYNIIMDLIEFNKISGNLLTAQTFDEFEVWFEKCAEIDKRSLYLFIKKEKENIPQEYIKRIKSNFVLL